MVAEQIPQAAEIVYKGLDFHKLNYFFYDAKVVKIPRNTAGLPMNFFCDARSHNRSILVNR